MYNFQIFFCFIEAKTISHDSHQSQHFPSTSFLMVSHVLLNLIQGILLFPPPSYVCFLSSIISVYTAHFRPTFPISHLHTPPITLYCLRAFHKYSSPPLSIGGMYIPIPPMYAWNCRWYQTLYILCFLFLYGANGQVAYIVRVRWTKGWFMFWMGCSGIV